MTEAKKVTKKATKKRDGTGNKRLKEDSFVVKCVKCGRSLSVPNGNYYRAPDGSIFDGVKDSDGKSYIPICKSCIKEMYTKYLHEQKDAQKAVYFTVRKLDMKFDGNAFEGAMSRSGGDQIKVIGYYIGQITSLPQYAGSGTFDFSEHIVVDAKSFDDEIANIKESSKLTPDDKRNLKDIKRIIGHNVFEGSGAKEYELKNMYAELVGFLTADEDLAQDQGRLSIVLQIIHNNSQIRNLDLFISVANNSFENSTQHMSDITSWITQKSKLVDANNKIYKENKSWLGNGGSNKSKLTMIMKKLKDYGFDEVLPNYYDIAESKAIKEIFDISHSSIVDTLNFSSEEENEIFERQRMLIQSKDREIAELFESRKELAKENVELQKKVDGV